MPAPIDAALDELRKALPPDRIVTSAEQLEELGRDESELGSMPPEVGVHVVSAEEVRAVFAIASRHRVPVVPVAARTGKSGGVLAPHGGIAVSLARMNRILEVAPADLVARAEPGVITGQLQAEVEKHGLFYPPDPNSLETCTLGGNVAENAGGPRALKYGVTRDYVLGLTVVLPTGEIVRTGHRSIKGVAGYDLTSLLVGSEGTLGIVTEVMVKLMPRPRHVATALVAFADVGTAAAAVSRVLAHGVLPRCMELLDELAVAAALKSSPFTLPPGAGAAILIETDGNDEEQVFGEIVRIGELVQGEAAGEVIVAQSEAQRRAIWETRRNLSINLKALHPRKLSEDVAVPRSRIPEMVERAKRAGERRGLAVATYGHAGDGNLHCNVLFDRAEERPRVDEALDEILRAAIELGGTITGEHGVGLAKRGYLELEQGRELVELQRRVKAAFDPLGILNPGKIFAER
jgi:glycolate oxidase